MPIYEYECRECGYRLDALQKMSDPPLSDCPECSRSSLKKLLSAPYFRLKGSGWYETDFKHSGGEKRDGAGKEAGDGESGKAGSASETGKEGDKAKASDGARSREGPASGAEAA